jgi:putative transposase
MRKTFKYRAYPTSGQETALHKIFSECCWVYNETLASKKALWDHAGENLTYIDAIKMLPAWKRMRQSLKTVFSQCLQDAQKRVDLAFSAFYRRVKAGEKPGYPRFKSWRRYDSVTYPQYGFGVKLVGDLLSVSKVGSLRLILHRPIEGIVKTVNIHRTSTGKWFVCFSCEVEAKAPCSPAPEEIVGIDLGLKTFAMLSNGKKIRRQRFFKQEQDALAKAQRRLEKFSKGTPEREHAKGVVSRIHERIGNRRDNFAHQESRKLVDGYGILCFEDLNIKGMLEEREYSKSISDAAWRKLVQFSVYKAVEAGRRVVLVDPKGTSQRCSRCGTVVPKDITVRVHDCSVCGLKVDRDLNSSWEVLNLGVDILKPEMPWLLDKRMDTREKERLGLQSQADDAPLKAALLPRSRAALAAAE